jgi:hypothetical protein
MDELERLKAENKSLQERYCELQCRMKVIECKVGFHVPEKVKIGGITYAVEKTDKLALGKVNYSGETDFIDCVIRIVPTCQQKMEADFCHEMVHGILDHLGYSDHDEKKVDEFGKALYMIFKDNPQMFGE